MTLLDCGSWLPTIKEYFENLYSNKLENLGEMDNYLGTYNHPKFNQQDMNYLNRSMTCNEIDTAIVSKKRKVEDLTNSPPNSTRPLRRPNTTLLKLFQEIERKATLQS
jgi:hypothetical protein